MKIKVLLLSVLFLSVLHANNVISGKVRSYETGEPLSGASILLLGTNRGTTTNHDGNFKLEKVKQGKHLIRVSYFGYKTEQIQISLPQDSNKLFEIDLEESAIDLDEVVVTGTRTEKSLKNVPVLTQVVNSKKIENLGVSTLQEVLEQAIPGIDFSQDGFGTSMKMQGLDAKYVLILIDGERLAGETKGNIDYNRLNASNIDKIEIVRGASSSLYGSNAIGGVINIITKRNLKPFELVLHSKISKYNELNYGASAAFKFGKFSSNTDYTSKSTEGYDLIPESPNSWTQEKFDDFTIRQKFSYKASDKIEFSAGGRYYQHEKFTASSRPVHPKNYDYAYNLKSKIIFDKSDNLNLSWSSDRFETYDVLERKNDKEELTYKHNYKSAKAIFNYKLVEKHFLTSGVEYNYESLLTSRIEGKNKSTSNVVFFMQDDITFSSLFTAIAGIRIDNHSEYGTNVTPKISLLYRWLPVNLRFSYGRGFRVPSLKERFMNFDHFGMFYVMGNENLKPETSDYFSLSGELIKENINLSMTLYANDLTNMIDAKWDPDDDSIIRYENVNKARIYGTDILLKVDLGKRFVVSGGYSFIDALDKTTDLQLWGTTHHSGRINLEYSFLKKNYSAHINLTGKVYGEKTFEEIDSDTNQKKSRIEDPYSLWNLTLNQRILKNYNLILGVENIFDHTDKINMRTISPGRKFFAGVKFLFEY
ncbi:MAG: TonB-dependent receptor domain-containing protein [Rhodothermaceae bacterium]